MNKRMKGYILCIFYLLKYYLEYFLLGGLRPSRLKWNLPYHNKWLELLFMDFSMV